MSGKEGRPWLFQPGQSGNPGGRPIGSRNKLSENFLKDALAAWKEHGRAALDEMATEDASAFCRMIAQILPKDFQLEIKSEDDRWVINALPAQSVEAWRADNAGIIDADPLVLGAVPADQADQDD